MPPLKLAIVGAGPSAFYVASRLLQLAPATDAPGQSLRIHLYDRLWAPHGLVRYGVAPDHPEVKNCTHKFNAAANDSRLSFYGNVNIVDSTTSNVPQSSSTRIQHALDLPISSILKNYSHLLIATGSPVPQTHPALPTATTVSYSSTSSTTSYPRVLPALSLVHWYTAHPSSPPPPPLETVRHVTIVGMGNVALDVARMLLSDVSRLEEGVVEEAGNGQSATQEPRAMDGAISQSKQVGFDLTQSVLSTLRRSAVKHVAILGRRGPHEAAFTTKELRELLNLPNATLSPGVDPELLQPPTGVKLSRQQTRLAQLMQKGSTLKDRNDARGVYRTWSLDFLRSPAGIRPAPPDATHGRALELMLEHTRLEPSDPSNPSSAKRAVPTGETSVLPTDLVVTSLGFVPELADVYSQLVNVARGGALHPDVAEAPTDAFVNRGRVPTDANGRVFLPPGTPTALADQQPGSHLQQIQLKNVYASGWASMGARGVLAATMLNAYNVAETVLQDYTSSRTAFAKQLKASSRAQTQENTSGSSISVPTSTSQLAEAETSLSGTVQQAAQTAEICLLNQSPMSSLPPPEIMRAVLDANAIMKREETAQQSWHLSDRSDAIVEPLGVGQRNAPSLSQLQDSGSAETSAKEEDSFVTTYDDWRRIDEEEVRQGYTSGKERERMDWPRVVAFLNGLR